MGKGAAILQFSMSLEYRLEEGKVIQSEKIISESICLKKS